MCYLVYIIINNVLFNIYYKYILNVNCNNSYSNNYNISYIQCNND